MKERLGLSPILAQRVQIGVERSGVGELHAAGDTAQERRALIAFKIVAGTRAYQRQDLRQCALLCLRQLGGCQHFAKSKVDLLGRHQFGCQFDHRPDHVDDARGNRAARHAVIFGLFRRLGKHQATCLLDRLDAHGAVAAQPRKNDGRAVAMLLRQ